DAASHQHALELGHRAEELVDLFVGGKSHHALDAGAIVPGAIKQHDLAAGRQVRGIAPEVPLRVFALAGGGQRRDPADARIEPLGDALDHAALAGGVAALEDHDHLELAVLHPVLQLDQFALQAQQLLEIDVTVERRKPLMDRLGVPELSEFAVVELELKLLVEVVAQILPDPLMDGLVILRVHRGSFPWTAGPYPNLPSA